MKEKYYDLKKLNKTSFVLLKPEDYEQLQQQLAEKDKEIKILKKALELACETIRLMCPTPYYICGGALADKLGIPMMAEPKDFDYFILQAKESEKDG